MQSPSYNDILNAKQVSTYPNGKSSTKQLELMQNDKASTLNSNPFPTFDEAVDHVQAALALSAATRSLVMRM